MTNEEKAVKQHLSKPRPQNFGCGCLGAQNGEPLCPCAMRWVERVDNKWYKIEEERSLEGIKIVAKLLDT